LLFFSWFHANKLIRLIEASNLELQSTIQTLL
jgi:hypothetical protein